jgi:anti-sigma B factor antagonist
VSTDAPHLTVDAQREGDRLIVTVAGEVDAATASTLEEGVVVDDPDVAVVDLRLDQVTFIDSSGLRALLMVRERVVSAGATVVLGSTSNLVDRLLEVTGLAGQFSASS